MRIHIYGVRGSAPVSSPDANHFGGNTTCLRIESDCIPKGRAFVIDAGSGFLPLSKALMNEGIWNIDLLMTHWHHDHTQGLLLGPHCYMDPSKLRVWGPMEHGKGPSEILDKIMESPVFPVAFAKVKHRFSCQPIEHIGTQVLVVHPVAGAKLLPINTLRTCEAEGQQLPLGRSKHDARECLIIYMYRTNHPDYTMSFRLEERPTGKVFVFLTDHENTDGIPVDLLTHVQGADLLIQDAQYSEAAYRTRTAGFGHGTPEYCVRLALKAGVEMLGLTHHDPFATDDDVRSRIAEAQAEAVKLGNAAFAETIFGCACYKIYDC